MKKRVIILCMVFLIIGCQEETYQLCPDNVTRVLDLNECPIEKPTCPLSCNDNNTCTRDSCNSATNYTCLSEEIIPCDGNGKCEKGEFPWSQDCPNKCNDEDICTNDNYNYEQEKCTFEDIIPCCGNEKCETGETNLNCNKDCEQLLDIKDVSYYKTERIPDAYSDLTGTDHIYLVVKFKIHNKGIDREEVMDYKKQNGFYYDPFKLRVEVDGGSLFNVEYDSDLLEGYADAMVIPKGNIRGAAVLFIIPRNVKHTRIIAYDRYGSKLDVADIY